MREPVIALQVRSRYIIWDLQKCSFTCLKLYNILQPVSTRYYNVASNSTMIGECSYFGWEKVQE